MKPPLNLSGSAPAKRATAIDSIISSMRSMGRGSWAILSILLALLFVTIALAYLGWTSAANVDVPASGYVALVFGVVVSIAVGCGLMALVFYSSRAGYDEPVRLVKGQDPRDPQP